MEPHDGAGRFRPRPAHPVARFDPEHAESLARRCFVSAIIDLRAEGCDDVKALHRAGIMLLHLPTPDQGAIGQPTLAHGIEFATGHLKVGRRVLVHCKHGIGRAPSLALCILVAGGLAPLDALSLVKRKRPVIAPSAVQYDCSATWLGAWKAAHIVGWEVPRFDAFGAVAYRPSAGVSC